MHFRKRMNVGLNDYRTSLVQQCATILHSLHYIGKEAERISWRIALPLSELLQPQCKKKNPQCSFACGYVRMQAIHICAHIYVKQTRRGICSDEQTGSSWQTDKSPLRSRDKVLSQRRNSTMWHVVNSHFSSTLAVARFICSLLPICISPSQIKIFYKPEPCIEMNNGNFCERF